MRNLSLVRWMLLEWLTPQEPNTTPAVGADSVPPVGVRTSYPRKLASGPPGVGARVRGVVR